MCFSHNALFHMKVRVCLKYFLNDFKYLHNGLVFLDRNKCTRYLFLLFFFFLLVTKILNLKIQNKHKKRIKSFDHKSQISCSQRKTCPYPFKSIIIFVHFIVQAFFLSQNKGISSFLSFNQSLLYKQNRSIGLHVFSQYNFLVPKCLTGLIFSYIHCTLAKPNDLTFAKYL